ncbi:unnamed protein product [Acanthocheilonema viteae]|uniref:Uncharacterized protein n=1 Tax=Acanthocheilonema viteae TaxID=6277 RepID=A0A498SIX3_ACAVI|nr:unnamed protein product [Acanthocheilonema viteae]
MEKRLRQRLEKQKIEVENALREKLMEMERQYELNTSEIVRYKAMLKKSHEENTELCYRWQRAAKLLEGIKFATTESENFQQRLEEKLGVLVKKFRNEANNSKTKMMTYVVDNFEAAMKVILSDEPNLHYFMQSNKDLTMVGNNELNKWSQITTENSSEKRKKSVKEEQKVLSDFKKFISNIDSLLKTFYQKQETELANSTSQIIGRVEKIKQTIKRAGDLNDILDVNKFISRVPQNILEEVKDMSDKFKILNKRMNEMSLEIGLRNDEEEKWRELIAEENKVMEACRKIDHEQQELEFILNRAELKYDQLYRQIYLGSNTVLEGSSRENIREFIED